MSGRFDGQVAVIAGATSGIGRSLASRLTAEGARVVGGGRDQGRLAALGREVELAMSLDLTREGSVEVFARAALDRMGRVDLLVQAAFARHEGAWRETPTEDLRRLHEVNVLGARRLAEAVLPDMIARGSGAMVVLADRAALRPGPGQGALAASMAGRVAWARSVGAELRGAGVDLVVAFPAKDSGEAELSRLMEDILARRPMAGVPRRARLAMALEALAPGRLRR